MYRVLGNISCEPDIQVKGQIMYFLVNASPPKLLGRNFKCCSCIGHTIKTLGNILRDFDPKVKRQIMYFLVNASPLKPLDVATSNFVTEYTSLCKLVRGNILCNHNPRVKIKSEKVGILQWCTIDCSLVIIYFCSFKSYLAVPKTIITIKQLFLLEN